MTKNAVLMIAYNNWEMTRDAVESVFNQDIPVRLTIVNNGSTDGTREYLESLDKEVEIYHLPQNVSPVRLANSHTAHIFERESYLLAVPNDVILPPNFYRLLLKWPRGFVCASQTREKGVESPETCVAVNECTPMAVILIRRWAYQAIMDKDGYFLDEGMFHYASDCCLALRMAACGIRGVQLSVPYYHFSSASLRLADNETRRKMEVQADADRAYFERKYGFSVSSLEYGQVAQDPNWRACGLASP